MVDAVAVADQSLGDAAEIEQAIPIGIVACHARDFQREHDADVAERNFRSHARKSRALGESGAGYTQVFVDDGHLLLGDRKSTRLNSSHGYISYAVFCLKKKK